MPKDKIAVIDRDMCKPKTCGFYLCKKVCPVNRSGEDCIIVSDEDEKPLIDEGKCITCGICVRKCPQDAIQVVNLPAELKERPVHRYGPNMFALYRLPVPKKKSVVGLIGPNGVGKTTVLRVMSGRIRPNSGVVKGIEKTEKGGWEEIIERFKGTELQDYLQKLSERGMTVAYKPQNVDHIPKKYKGKVKKFLGKVDEEGRLEEVVSSLGMERMLNRKISNLSGGELQFLGVAATLLKDRDFYFFDEPSSYLDIFSRLVVGNEIRRLSKKAVVMVVEHDLALSDYLADQVHILYGKPGVFGIVSKPYGVRVGINTYLEGYIKEDNVRFRKEKISFDRGAKSGEKGEMFLKFPAFEKNFKDFSLRTEPGEIYSGEVIGILGPNSIGKTTFIKLLAGKLEPDQGEKLKKEGLEVAYKPQRLAVEKESQTVQTYLLERAGKIDSKVSELLGLDRLVDRKMGGLSGGEIQTVFITGVLMQESDIVLLDEPSAFLDVEQRLRVAKLIRRQAEKKEKPFFVVDHDLLFVDVISDRLMVFSGKRGNEGKGSTPQKLRTGMNSFLKKLGITYRRDPNTGRPRINKPGSQKDREQKRKGEYYYV